MRVETTSSTHTLIRVVTADRRAVVVKQVPREAALAGRSLSHELFVYRLAKWIPAIAAALPEPIIIDETHQLLAVESLDSGSSWPGVNASPSISSPDLAERLGAIMAGWHQATQDTGLWPSPALGILEMPDALPVASAGRAHPTQLLMRRIAHDAELSITLRATRAAWRDRCLIHGDIRRENWIAVRNTQGVDPKVLDWELSGSGDPAWDLGSVLAEVALDSVREQRVDDQGWSSDQENAVRNFFLAYVTHGGLLNAADPAESSHVVRCGVARLLHVACEWAELQPGVEDGPVPAVLAQARLLLRAESELIARLAEWSRA